MNEKNFSLIVIAFVFAIAIPSTLYLFSDNMGTGDVIITGLPKQQTNYGDDPAPYSWRNEGILVPIYEGGQVVRYERQTPNRVGRELDRPDWYGTYSYMKSGCPPGCVNVKKNEVRELTLP